MVFLSNNISCHKYKEFVIFLCRLFHLSYNKFRLDALIAFMFICVYKNKMQKWFTCPSFCATLLDNCENNSLEVWKTAFLTNF